MYFLWPFGNKYNQFSFNNWYFEHTDIIMCSKSKPDTQKTSSFQPLDKFSNSSQGVLTKGSVTAKDWPHVFQSQDLRELQARAKVPLDYMYQHTHLAFASELVWSSIPALIPPPSSINIPRILIWVSLLQRRGVVSPKPRRRVWRWGSWIDSSLFSHHPSLARFFLQLSTPSNGNPSIPLFMLHPAGVWGAV